MTNSGVLQPSKGVSLRELTLVVSALLGLISLFAWALFQRGYILYYGDAQAHLNNSRSIIDSRTPGYDQLGTVWLPLLHVLCLPFVGNDWLWSTGLAGTIPVAFCFVIAGTFFYLATRETYGSIAAMAAVSCLSLNPNMLYLSAIPMTETVFLAGLAMFLFAGCRFQTRRAGNTILLGIAASWMMSLTRYDGWFLIPFEAAWFAYYAETRRVLVLAGFVALASLAPLYWFGHNWWETANALDFYNGPYSPRAIQGGKPYPGYHEWANAVRYYVTAGRLCAGWILLLLGLVGFGLAVRTKALVPLLFLLLTPLFYVVSMYSSGGSPIYVPQLEPFSYYNTRYGMAVVAFAAFAAGGVAVAIPAKWKKLSFALPLLAVAPWCLRPSAQNWICWKESEVNSELRRSWTRETARYLTEHYQTGQGIEASFGDLTGVFCRDQIHLKEILHEGNGPEWLAAATRPDLAHREIWLISQRDSGAIPPYEIVHQIYKTGAPAVRIYRRSH